MDVSIPTIHFGHRAYLELVFKKTAAATGKAAVPQAVREDKELIFSHEIAPKVEKYKILPSLILSLDQTPIKFIPCSSCSQA